MKTLHRISLGLIAIPLLVILWSSLSMITFVQPMHTYSSGFVYANFVHEAGFARIVLAIIGLLILFIPYRKGERWALAALEIMMVCYVLPVDFFFSPGLGSWPILRNLPEPRMSGLSAINFERYFFNALLLGGLVIAVPQFLKRQDGLKGTDTK